MARTGQNGPEWSERVKTGRGTPKPEFFSRANAQGGMCLCARFGLCVFESLGCTDRRVLDTYKGAVGRTAKVFFSDRPSAPGGSIAAKQALRNERIGALKETTGALTGARYHPSTSLTPETNSKYTLIVPTVAHELIESIITWFVSLAPLGDHLVPTWPGCTLRIAALQ